jgi:low affinity Fe/Cu permease
VILLVMLALLPLSNGRHIVFATSATAVITLVLILIAFQVQKLQPLLRTIAKLDELLELLRDTKRDLSPLESKPTDARARGDSSPLASR